MPSVQVSFQLLPVFYIRTNIYSVSMVDTSIEHSPATCAPSVSSNRTTSSSTTYKPSSSTTTAKHGGTIQCAHCNAKFQLGKNGRRGQTSNLRKHIKIHHPETIPGFQRVIYQCRHGCGARDPNKSNIKAHESKHCAKRKGKQPRRRGKWRQTITESS